MKLKIIAIACHRNGICGAPFEVVLFEDQGPEGSRKVAILFEEPRSCAVLDVAKLAAGDIEFGSNSWRGDNYEPHLREAMKTHLQAFVDELRKPKWWREGAMNTIEKMRSTLAGEITVRTWWGCPGLSGEAFRSWFLDCLMAKINRHDRRQGRRLTPDYQTSLYRDARRLRDTQQRVIHRQFETDIFQRRFGHLLTND